MSEMIERVALAIKRAQTRNDVDLSRDGPWRRFELSIARAAIEAMLEPTRNMVEAYRNVEPLHSGPADIFRAMITAALQESQDEHK